MKRAFTLVELMAVAGLMGLLATLSVVSWGAITRAMSDRAAHEALEGFVRSAIRIASTGETTVVLRFRSSHIPADDDFTEQRMCRAVAVRAVGRVSKVVDGHPWDEFADEGPVRLDESPTALPLSGDRADWKIGDPYGRAVAALDLPPRYFVEEGEVALVPDDSDSVRLTGSIVLNVTRSEGKVEAVGPAISAGRLL